MNSPITTMGTMTTRYRYPAPHTILSNMGLGEIISSFLSVQLLTFLRFRYTFSFKDAFLNSGIANLQTLPQNGMSNDELETPKLNINY